MPDPTPLTDAELDAIEALCDAATPGPWTCDPRGRVVFATGAKTRIAAVESLDGPDGPRVPGRQADRARERRANGQLMANAREDVPRLLAEVRRLRAKVEEYEDWASERKFYDM